MLMIRSHKKCKQLNLKYFISAASESIQCQLEQDQNQLIAVEGCDLHKDGNCNRISPPLPYANISSRSIQSVQDIAKSRSPTQSWSYMQENYVQTALSPPAGSTNSAFFFGGGGCAEAGVLCSCLSQYFIYPYFCCVASQTMNCIKILSDQEFCLFAFRSDETVNAEEMGETARLRCAAHLLVQLPNCQKYRLGT